MSAVLVPTVVQPESFLSLSKTALLVGIALSDNVSPSLESSNVACVNEAVVRVPDVAKPFNASLTPLLVTMFDDPSVGVVSAPTTACIAVFTSLAVFVRLNVVLIVLN
jgi:hypothetical protein